MRDAFAATESAGLSGVMPEMPWPRSRRAPRPLESIEAVDLRPACRIATKKIAEPSGAIADSSRFRSSPGSPGVGAVGRPSIVARP